jgi:hypothetical protein
MEPTAGFAWMEWKPVHCEVRFTEFNDSGEPPSSVETDAV